MKMSEISKPMTIRSATDSHGNVSRAKAERIYDPKGWFKKNKSRISKRFKPAGGSVS